MRTLSPAQARFLRSRGQGLGGGVRYGSAAEAVCAVLAVQAQDARAAALGIRARTSGVHHDDVRRALSSDRTLVRSWALRGTLHLVPAADLRWLLRLLGPRLVHQSARRYRDLGLDEEVCARAEAALSTYLSTHGPATRAELTDLLASAGVAPHGQAPYHLLRRAALRGVVCHGPERAGEATFVSLAEWLPQRDGPTGEDAAVELARRYLHTHAPASPADFAAWSGLSTSTAQAAWRTLGAAGALVPCRVDDVACALPTSRAAEAELAPPPDPEVRLLPAYDGYLTAYRSRALTVPSAHERGVWPGGGQLRPTLLVDGRARGTWSLRGETDIELSWFTPADEANTALAAGVSAESADVARFLAES